MLQIWSQVEQPQQDNRILRTFKPRYLGWAVKTINAKSAVLQGFITDYTAAMTVDDL